MHRHDRHSDAPQAEAGRCWYKDGRFIHELTSHLPFSILSVTIGLMLAGVICFLADSTPASVQDAVVSHAHDPDDSGHNHAHDEPSLRGFLMLFHLFHPAHMLFSAAATAAMFMRYDRNWVKSVVIGLSGAIVVCGISDIIMPHCSALIMNKQLSWHICVLEHPMLVFPFAGFGVTLGILAAAGGSIQSTIFSHSMHVFVSTMASIFYLIGAFGLFEWVQQLGLVFLFICLAVVIPCCLSDIVYPLLFARKAREEYSESGHIHPH